ncbi:zinc-binding dehydrogenase [Streptomyces sp. NPDC091377]|uniref:zinc-binding dehydrogenase n=1 Tax=Streptomyces sp. NPDC091377 TaxID=3365995 RepID=UPI003813C6D0
MVLEEKWPVLGRHERAADWLRIRTVLGRAPQTTDAYARGLAEYLLVCEREGINPLVAKRLHVAAFVKELATRPSRRGGNVVVLDSGAGSANATLQQRLVPVRLFYDYLNEEGLRESNPVGLAAGSGGICAFPPRTGRSDPDNGGTAQSARENSPAQPEPPSGRSQEGSVWAPRAHDRRCACRWPARISRSSAVSSRSVQIEDHHIVQRRVREGLRLPDATSSSARPSRRRPIARAAGADVLLVEPDAYRRSVAEKLGVTALNPATTDIAAEVATWSGGAGAAVAFEVSGAAGGVTTAVDCLAARGRLVLVAIHPTPRELNLHRFFWRELSLIGARLYQRADFEEAARLLAAGHIPAETLISRTEPLERAREAFAALDGGTGEMKILIDCRITGTGPTEGNDPA